MEISEGMYIKYIRGVINGYVPPRIAKVTDCSDKDLIKIDNGQVILRNDILKASYKLIDLIDRGDYVNGYRVRFVYRPDGDKVFRIEIEKDTLQGHIISKSEQIKSIVTKEQFENMAYEVEE